MHQPLQVRPLGGQKGERMTGTTKDETSQPDHFEDHFRYLTAWFRLLGPARQESESAAAMTEIPSFEPRRDFLAGLQQITARSLEAGIELPFEAFVHENGLDLTDRLLLLTLLRSALDPLSQGGLRFIRILWALGADSVGRQIEIRRRLEEEGALRDLGLIECAAHSSLLDRLYRLPQRMVGPLSTGEGDGLGLPRVPQSRLEALELLDYDIRQLIDALKLPLHESHQIWQGVRKGVPGWDRGALRRGRLAARLEASYRQDTDAIGAELRRLDLTGAERLIWAVLFFDSSAKEVGLAAPYLLSFSGWHDDAEAAAERLLGKSSKLAKAGALRFSRADAPLLTRVVALSQEARARVALWPRTAFAMTPGTSLDLGGDETRPLGFLPNGGAVQDRAVAARRSGR
jgi:hypothetical protein